MHDPSIIGQYGCAALALLVSFLLHFSTDEIILVIIMCGVVIALEYMNSALEAALDFESPQNAAFVKKAKDLAAGSVLIASLAAGIIGIILVIRHL